MDRALANSGDQASPKDRGMADHAPRAHEVAGSSPVAPYPPLEADAAAPVGALYLVARRRDFETIEQWARRCVVVHNVGVPAALKDEAAQ